MLIVSRFHDYYDSIRAFGVDKSCVYKRTSEFVPKVDKLVINYWPTEEIFNVNKNGYWINYYVNKQVIGFCGEMYPLLSVKKTHCVQPEQYFYFYSHEEFKQFFDEEGVNLKSSRLSRWWYSDRDFSVKNEVNIKRFFDKKTWSSLVDRFQEHKCPVFIYGSRNVEAASRLQINPQLIKYRFFKVKDSQTAFQDIYMYMSGVLGSKGPEPLPVSDKIKAQAHGHDGKYSFKKAPGEPKRRKKK